MLSGCRLRDPRGEGTADRLLEALSHRGLPGGRPGVRRKTPARTFQGPLNPPARGRYGPPGGRPARWDTVITRAGSVGACPNSRPSTAPTWAISLPEGPTRSSRAISEALSVAGTASIADGATASAAV